MYLVPSCLRGSCTFWALAPPGALGASGRAVACSLRHAYFATAAAQRAPSVVPVPPGPPPAIPYSAEAYKELVARAFDACAAPGGQDPLAQQLAARTLTHAQLLRGERVLDVASGAGLLLVPAARAVGHSGRVLGLDLSPGMVELARAALNAARLRAPQAGVRLADAEAVALQPASYDVITCSAALPYMYDMPAALSRWRGWLRSGGRLVLNCFKGPYDPECALFYQLAARHELDRVFVDPLAAVGSRERCTALLEGSGFRRVQVTEERIEVVAPAASARSHAEAMWDSSTSSPHHSLQWLQAAAGGGGASEGGGGGTGGGGLPAPAGAPGGGDAASSSGDSFGGSLRGGGGAGPGDRAGAGGSRGLGAAALAAVASRGGASHGRRGEPPPPALGPRGRGGGPLQGPRQQQQQQQQQPGAQPQAGDRVESAAAPGVGAAIDPAALRAFREDFMAAAERSVAARLRGGAVRTTIGVLYAVAHAP